MASIMTNASAMTALQTLNSISKDLATTQNRISTGLRVNEASDNAAYWSIATTMRSDNKANSVVQDALGLAAGKVDTAYTAMDSAKDVVDQIKEKVLLAKTSSEEDRTKIQSEITALQAQLTEAAGASYAGTSLLTTDSTGTATEFSVISSYNRDSTGAVTTGQISVTLDDVRLIDSGGANAGILDTEFTTTGAGAATASVMTLDVTTAGLDDTDFNDMLTGIETALSDVATGASSLGAAKARIDLQNDFTEKLMDAIDRGVGQLVDADMNEESTRLSALQTQQQLGIQALSIANSNAQNILSLFR
ncbi:flagellin N-terminal helical domain-containing protein [Chelativorans sp. YIM 93263]|uniref:flagellin N-terminal helical domain-containing protein n=1 Tax=Chelativorans sp. YIM 93263 TaxID=2906648 RepID=UPI002379E9DA|nr:flagellin [Chelativorans sp. YIM 93263]